MSYCAEQGCTDDVSALGLCASHYQRQWQAAQIEPSFQEFEAAVWARVGLLLPGCIVWPGPFKNGRPIVSVRGFLTNAAKVAHQSLTGEAPGRKAIWTTCPTNRCIRHQTMDPTLRYRPPITEKPCTRCKRVQPAVSFQVNLHVKSGLNSWCKDCTLHQARRLRGVTEDHVSLRPAPGQLCEICNGDNAGREMFLDHDHSTGDFRGWLCNDCNHAIGLLGDDVDRLLSAVDYLKRSALRRAS